MPSHYRRRMSHWFHQLFPIRAIFRRSHRSRLYWLLFRSLRPRLFFLARVTFRRTQSGLLCGSSSPLFVKWFRCPHIKCLSPPISALTLVMREPSMTRKLPSALTSQTYNLCTTRTLTQVICRSFLSHVKSRQPLESPIIQLYLLSTLKLPSSLVPFRLPAVWWMIFRRIHRGLLYHALSLFLVRLSVSLLMSALLSYRLKSLSYPAIIVRNARLP